MKKNYTCPMVEVKAFDFEDVVMTSGVVVTPDMSATGGATPEQKSTFKASVSTATSGAGIVVEW